MPDEHARVFKHRGRVSSGETMADPPGCASACSGDFRCRRAVVAAEKMEMEY